MTHLYVTSCPAVYAFVLDHASTPEQLPGVLVGAEVVTVVVEVCVEPPDVAYMKREKDRSCRDFDKETPHASRWGMLGP